jgi:glycosyltransferase involved in cell wall biosynthesis
MALSEELRRGAELLVIGDGPHRTALERQTAELGLSSNVTFTGQIEHTKLEDQLVRSQAFVFTGLREFGGGVVLEAMANGLPPIVVNYGGPGDLVKDDCGIRLPMAPREELVGRLVEAMIMLLRDPDRCRSRVPSGFVVNSLGQRRRPKSWRSVAKSLTFPLPIPRSFLSAARI